MYLTETNAFDMSIPHMSHNSKTYCMKANI